MWHGLFYDIIIKLEPIISRDWLYNVWLISGLEHYYSLGTQLEGLVTIYISV